MRFSVIIPLYNKAPYVKKAIESVIAQTFLDFELIVVDDGSDDDSFAVAKKVLKNSVVDYRLIHQENAGVSIARNNGVAASHGDYICFLDADDWWASSFLARMDWLINEYPEAGIYGTNYYYVKNGSQKVCVRTADTGYINYCQVYADGKAMPLTSISVALKRHVFFELKGFKTSLKFGEDFDLWIRIALRYKVAFLNEPLAYYNQDSNPKWRGIRNLPDPKLNMLWNLDYLEEEEKSNPACKQLLDNLRTYGLFQYYLSKKYREAARQELKKVDWGKQPQSTKNLYNTPVFILKCGRVLRKLGSIVKQGIIKHL